MRLSILFGIATLSTIALICAQIALETQLCIGNPRTCVASYHEAHELNIGVIDYANVLPQSFTAQLTFDTGTSVEVGCTEVFDCLVIPRALMIVIRVMMPLLWLLCGVVIFATIRGFNRGEMSQKI